MTHEQSDLHRMITRLRKSGFDCYRWYSMRKPAWAIARVIGHNIEIFAAADTDIGAWLTFLGWDE